MRSVIAFFMSLPEIIGLIKQMVAHYEKHRLNSKIKADLKELGAAYRDRDGERMAGVFNKRAKERVSTEEI